MLRALSILFLAVGLIAAPNAAALPAFYGGSSGDGKVAVFTTVEQMVPGDTDQQEDVFLRSFDEGLGEYVTREISIGPSGGNDARTAHYEGMSRDGREVFFSTKEKLVTGDDDQGTEDIYVRNLIENRTILVSQGDASCAAQGCGSGTQAAIFLPGGIAPEGGIVFFGSEEKLAEPDPDGTGFDIYARDIEAGTTTFVSAPDPSCAGCVSKGLPPQFQGIDDSGGRAFFTTDEELAGADVDSGEGDLYVRDLGAGTTRLISTPGTCPPDLPVDQNCEPSYGGSSADGSDVYFETNDRILAGADTDKSQDVYEWSEGTLILVSTGPAGGNGDANVSFAEATPDGDVAFFETDESLVSGDIDSSQDVYRRAGGGTTLVSVGEAGKGSLAFPAFFEWVSRTGPEVVVFTTSESLTGADVDSSQDVYVRSGGVTQLVSDGPDGGDAELSATFADAAEDGSGIFFVTAESLVTDDTDPSPDLYLWSGGETALVSGGQTGGNGAFPASPQGVSDTGSRAFFTTQERLAVDDDFSGEQDVYAWSESGTLLVSVKNSPDLVIGPPPPSLEQTSPSSPNPSTTPTIIGQAQAGSFVKVYKTSNCSGEPVAQGTAAQLASPGLTVTVPVATGSTTNYRATAEAEGVVSACSSQISYKQEDPPPPPAEEGSGEGDTGNGTAGGKTGKTSGGSGKGIEYVAPQLKITFGPAFKTRQRRPVFRFADTTGQPGTNFFCRVDKKAWTGCTSPIKVKKLKLGRHVFSVKAVNAIGTPGAGPQKRAFKVVKR